jgi:cytochrome c556
VCSISNLDICSDEDKATIATLKTKSKEELEAIEAKVTEAVEKAQSDYDAAVEQLQADYEKMTADLNEKQDTLRKESHYKWVVQLLVPSGSGDDAAKEEL